MARAKLFGKNRSPVKLLQRHKSSAILVGATIALLASCSQQDFGFLPVEIDSKYTYNDKTREFDTQSGFSLILPNRPHSDDIYDLGFTNTHQCIACDYPDATYFVGKETVQVPFGMDPTGYSKLALAGLDVIKGGLRGSAELNRTAVYSRNGFPFADSQGTTQRGCYRARCYFDQKRMMLFYQVVEGDKTKVNSKESDLFFDSFKLRPADS